MRALDQGAWGNRLMVAAAEEPNGLVASAEVLTANPPPGPGMFSSLQLTTITGVESGTRARDERPRRRPAAVAGAAQGAPRRSRRNRLVLLDPPGLTAAHMAAVNAAPMAGTRASRALARFSLMVMLRRRPDPAVPTRDENLLDQEVFRYV